LAVYGGVAGGSPGTACCKAAITLTPARAVPTIAGLCLGAHVRGTKARGTKARQICQCSAGRSPFEVRLSEGIYGDDDTINPYRPQ
jgi:hypothetical protein